MLDGQIRWYGNFDTGYNSGPEKLLISIRPKSLPITMTRISFISFSFDKNENGLFRNWNLLNFLTFRQEVENWTGNKRKEHNT